MHNATSLACFFYIMGMGLVFIFPLMLVSAFAAVHVGVFFRARRERQLAEDCLPKARIVRE